MSLCPKKCHDKIAVPYEELVARATALAHVMDQEFPCVPPCESVKSAIELHVDHYFLLNDILKNNDGDMIESKKPPLRSGTNYGLDLPVHYSTPCSNLSERLHRTFASP